MEPKYPLRGLLIEEKELRDDQTTRIRREYSISLADMQGIWIRQDLNGFLADFPRAVEFGYFTAPPESGWLEQKME